MHFKLSPENHVNTDCLFYSKTSYEATSVTLYLFNYLAQQGTELWEILIYLTNLYTATLKKHNVEARE
jgi:hypothetical protein